MVRNLAMLVGAAFVAVLAWSLFWTVKGQITEPAAPTVEATEFHKHPKALSLQSDGWFGTYDKRQLQRGFQVYQEVCSACHSIRLVAFRDLKEIGYNDAQVKAIAKGWKIPAPSINPETGETATRPNVPSDHFPLPFANEVAARAANNNALPPDLSLMTKARHGGAAYVYSILTGYEPQSKELLKAFPDVATPPGLHANPYFPTMNIAMAQQLTTDGQVQYMDGTKPTVDQMAKDVSAFLVWTAEPELEWRHDAGFAAAIFLLIFCFLAWGAYQNVWRDVKH
jgi:ubiquinol-cytochrome c reductase cytochrome c1 subunit